VPVIRRIKALIASLMKMILLRLFARARRR
jgi:hypothetical protein